MSKPKNKPGIHLHKTIRPIYNKKTGRFEKYIPEWYWNIIASNGREIARSSETYSRKRSAGKSINVAAKIFRQFEGWESPKFYDHSKKDSPLKSYL